MKVCENSGELNYTVEQSKPNWLDKLILAKLTPLLERSKGTLKLTLPSDCYSLLGQGVPYTDIHIKHYRSFIRLYFGGINGFSESYIAGEWESSNLTELVNWALSNEKALQRLSTASFVTQSLHNLYHWRRDNTRKGSRKNIAAHYDLGNEFYKHWLDKSMTYSAALYPDKNASLEAAQQYKNKRILQMLNPKNGDHIVEIGCGWGGFATQAAEEHNLKVHGVTLSKEQLAWGHKKVTDKGLQDLVHLSLTDYRDLQHKYDGVVSIEMFEAVGEAHWDTYFSNLKRVLKPKGNAVLQVISIEDERFNTYRKQADFIQRYIFPGGMLPSVSRLKEKIDEHGFELVEMQLFGKDYARTLRAWNHMFTHNWEQIKELGFDERFYRLWQYYLCYCEGGFEQGSIDVGLYMIRKKQSN